jgi:hypothetical protein
MMMMTTTMRQLLQLQLVLTVVQAPLAEARVLDQARLPSRTPSRTAPSTLESGVCRRPDVPRREINDMRSKREASSIAPAAWRRSLSIWRAHD